jgi:maltose alpha-D-glucosyltransferase/alpha-amylase
MSNSVATNELLAAFGKSLPPILPDFLAQRRWFGSKARVIQSVEVSDVVPLVSNDPLVYLFLIHIEYATGLGEMYALPLTLAAVDEEQSPGGEPAPSLRINRESSSGKIVLYDALSNQPFLTFLLGAISRGDRFPGVRGEVRAVSGAALRSIWEPSQGPLAPSLMKAEQSNSSVVYANRLVLKLFRRLEEGLNPDLEIGSFLTERTEFRNVPLLAGHLEYVSNEGERITLGILQGYIPNHGDAWQYTLKALAAYYEQAQSAAGTRLGKLPHAPILALAEREVPPGAKQRIGSYLESARLLGVRTAQLHVALSTSRDQPAFAPEPFTGANQRELVKSALDLIARTFQSLRRQSERLSQGVREEASKVVKLEEGLRQRVHLLEGFKISAMRTRIHGDYHLGQVLFTGDDFVIIDFEGEPARPLSERRNKNSPLQDVAGMLRSFHYAAYAPLLGEITGPQVTQERLNALDVWAQYWQTWVSTTFLKSYLRTSGSACFVPQSREELAVLLDAFVITKAVYELGYELNNRPSWLRIPLQSVSKLVDAA